MMTKTLSGTVLGVHAVLVEVEVDARSGVPRIDTVGLAEGAVKESKVRVETALGNCGFRLGARRITVNLAPADLKKEGTAFDLPMAVGMYTAISEPKRDRTKGWMFAGELSLEGALRPVRGVLPMAVAAREAGLTGIVVPKGNAREAAVVEGIEVRSVTHFKEVCDFIDGKFEPPTEHVDVAALFTNVGDSGVDFSEVRGQAQVKRALEVAAAGGHNLLMMGPPGSGKTMLAKRLPTILPGMSFAEAVDTTRIYSVAGLLAEGDALVTRRPFRSPHHTISDGGLVGGGGIPRPGEVSLAHNGVLFLDELPEFKKHVLEALRQPLEDKRVTISRAAVSIAYPASFMLIAAMNPCPCGFYGDPLRRCVCHPGIIGRYRSRVSGPLLDRIDLQVEVPPVRYRELAQAEGGETSAAIRQRVERARTLQRERFVRHPRIHCNAQMGPQLIRANCALAPASQQILGGVIDRLGMSARSHDRILKVARTIADLAESATIQSHHLSEAIGYRALDRASA